MLAYYEGTSRDGPWCTAPAKRPTVQVWRDGAFKGNYRRFHKNIVRRTSPNQTPNYFRAGKVNPDFEARMPFTV